jgi:hypothetical protein
MKTPPSLSSLFKSKSLIFVLLLGNAVLGLTTFVQSEVIQDQKHLIHLLFSDSAELASLKIAATMAAHKAKAH